MKLPILILLLFGIGFVLVGGCTNTPSQPLTATPTMEQPTTPTVRVPATLVQSTLPVSTIDTVCGELVYCGYAPAGFETQPVTSSRCDQLYTLKMQNDQKVLQCLKNPPEAGSNNSGERSQCMQGIGTVGVCARYGIIIDRDNGSGGNGNDESGSDRSIRQTKDDGYIVIGGINRVGSGYSTEDVWVVKLNSVGEVQWQKVLGGDGFDSGRSIEPTNDDTVVSKTAKELLHISYTRKLPVRLLGVRLSNFNEEEQMELALSPADEKKQAILKAVDIIRKKFGDKVIHVGGE